MSILLYVLLRLFLNIYTLMGTEAHLAELASFAVHQVRDGREILAPSGDPYAPAYWRVGVIRALRQSSARSSLPTMPQHLAFGANPRERKTVLPAKRIGGRLKQALDLMVWGDGEGRYLPDNEAAAIAGLNVVSIRNALHKPHVLAYYKQQREVLRSRESPANIHRLCEIRDAANNMPAVNAIKALEGLDEEGLMRRTTDTPTPGICIRIVSIPSGLSETPKAPLIEAGEP